MRSKRLYLLLIILAALIGITWVHRRLERPRESLKLLSGFGEVRKVALHRGDSTVVLELADSDWKITSPIESRTDQKAVDELIDAATEVRLGETVTRRREMHETFEVDEARGTGVSLYSDSDSISFIVGKAVGPDEGYIRMTGEDAVYLAQNFSRHVLSRGLDHWRDKSILVMTKEDVQRIDFYDSTGAFSLSREEGSWRVDGADADSTKVERFLATLEGLRADGFLHQQKIEEEVSISIGLIGARQHKIIIGRPSNDRYPVVREGGGAIFFVNKWKADGLKKKPSDFQ
jgi:hypothetical protein